MTEEITEEIMGPKFRSYTAHIKMTLLVSMPILAEHSRDARDTAEYWVAHKSFLDEFNFEEAKKDIEVEVVSVSFDPTPKEDEPKQDD